MEQPKFLQARTSRLEFGDSGDLPIDIFLAGIDYRTCASPEAQMQADHLSVGFRSLQTGQRIDVDEAFYKYLVLIRTNYNPDYEA